MTWAVRAGVQFAAQEPHLRILGKLSSLERRREPDKLDCEGMRVWGPER